MTTNDPKAERAIETGIAAYLMSSNTRWGNEHLAQTLELAIRAAYSCGFAAGVQYEEKRQLAEAQR